MMEVKKTALMKLGALASLHDRNNFCEMDKNFQGVNFVIGDISTNEKYQPIKYTIGTKDNS